MTLMIPEGFQERKNVQPTPATPTTQVDPDVLGLTPEVRPVGFTQDITPKKGIAAEGGFIDRVGGMIGERLEKVERGSKEYTAGEISYPEFALRGAGFIAGSLFDVVGEGLMTILSELTPDEAENYLKELAATGTTKIADTETVQKAMQLYGELDQRTKDNLGDIFNVTMAGMPAGPVSKGVGGKLTASAVQSDKNVLSKYVLNQSDSVKKDRAAELGLPENMRTIKKREDRILNTVVSLPGVGASTSRDDVMVAINKEINKLRAEIDNELLSIPGRVDKGALIRSVTEGMTNALGKKKIYKDKAFKETRRKIQSAFTTAFKEFSGDPKDLMKLRREFDANVKEVFKGDVHETAGANRELVAAVRDQINNFAESSIESAKGSSELISKLRRQHNLLIARDDLAYNIAREGSVLDRAVEFVNSHPFGVLSATGGTGVAAKMLSAEPTAVGAGLLGIGYGLSRPSVRRGAGAAISSGIPAKGLLFGGMGPTGEQ